MDAIVRHAQFTVRKQGPPGTLSRDTKNMRDGASGDKQEGDVKDRVDPPIAEALQTLGGRMRALALRRLSVYDDTDHVVCARTRNGTIGLDTILDRH